MQESHFNPAAEPFGQRGVLPLLWPTFVILCTLGLCASLLMLQRSSVIWDMVSNTSAGRQVTVSSVMGRLVVTIMPVGTGSESTGSTWDFDSRPFDSIQDGWQESWQKMIGIQWGDETLRQYNRQPMGFWRLRIRWRTLALLYAIPVAMEITRRIARRFLRRVPTNEAYYAPAA